MIRFRRRSVSRRRKATTRAYTSEWFPGASLERRLGWRHEPDRDECWASMDYDQRWSLTCILEPELLTSKGPRNHPLPWEMLLERWRSYKRLAA